MTRAQIREKYGVVTLETESVANEELSEKEAEVYEGFIKMGMRNFNSGWQDDMSDNIE